MANYRARVCQQDGCPNMTASGPSGWRCPAHRKPQRSPSSIATGNREFRERIKPRILKRDKVCVYCQSAPATVVDHIEPVKYGGTNEDSNLVGACEPCNHAKRNPAKYREMVLALRQRQEYAGPVTDIDTLRADAGVSRLKP